MIWKLNANTLFWLWKRKFIICWNNILGDFFRRTVFITNCWSNFCFFLYWIQVNELPANSLRVLNLVHRRLCGTWRKLEGFIGCWTLTYEWISVGNLSRSEVRTRLDVGDFEKSWWIFTQDCVHKAGVSHILSYVKVTSYLRTLIIKYFEDYQRFYINVVTSVVKLFLQTYHHHLLISRHRRYSEKGETESYLWRINQVKQINSKNNFFVKRVYLIFI